MAKYRAYYRSHILLPSSPTGRETGKQRWAQLELYHRAVDWEGGWREAGAYHDSVRTTLSTL